MRFNKPRRHPQPQPDGTPNARSADTSSGGQQDPHLYAPAEAAARLRVPESWLRRRAGRRLIPCTFLDKHLRFSATDLAGIIAAAEPATGRRATRRRPRAPRPPDLPHPRSHASITAAPPSTRSE
ncbi:hypothetical protein AB0J20_30565 [Micromonospora costi]|uniref:hypothetical protein n=1 Tax=Micromonospora costi TaxID=1530042 RepID=UPI0033C766FE